MVPPDHITLLEIDLIHAQLSCQFNNLSHLMGIHGHDDKIDHGLGPVARPCPAEVGDVPGHFPKIRSDPDALIGAGISAIHRKTDPVNSCRDHLLCLLGGQEQAIGQETGFTAHLVGIGNPLGKVGLQERFSPCEIHRGHMAQVGFDGVPDLRLKPPLVSLVRSELGPGAHDAFQVAGNGAFHLPEAPGPFPAGKHLADRSQGPVPQ